MKQLRTWGRYLIYLCRHKWYVSTECYKVGIFVEAIMHDWSKLLPSEFFAYAAKFYGGDYAYKYFEVEQRFDMAWFYHQRRNKHHWDYWVNSEGQALPMPAKYVKQMICDWKAMGRKFGDTASEFYETKQSTMNLHKSTIEVLETLLRK